MSIKEPTNELRRRYGIEYYNQLKHKINLKQKYKISYHIDNNKYGVKEYKKSV